MPVEDARVNIIVTGRVQGVFFRASALEQAQRLNLHGWVKNLADRKYTLDIEDLSGFGFLFTQRGTPRTYGINLTVNF